MAKRNSVGSMQRNLQSSKNFQPQYGTAQDDDGENGVCAALITFFSYILVFLTLPISIWGCVKVRRRERRLESLTSILRSKYRNERVKDREMFSVLYWEKCLGGTGVRESRHIQAGKTPLGWGEGAGIILHPSLHRYLQVGYKIHINSYRVFAMSHIRCVDLRTGAFDVPPQEILTRDSVSVQPSAICPSLLVCSLGDHLSGRGGLLPGKYHQCLPFKIFAKYSVLHSKVSFLCNTNKTKSSV